MSKLIYSLFNLITNSSTVNVLFSYGKIPKNQALSGSEMWIACFKCVSFKSNLTCLNMYLDFAELHLFLDGVHLLRPLHPPRSIITGLHQLTGEKREKHLDKLWKAASVQATVFWKTFKSSHIWGNFIIYGNISCNHTCVHCGFYKIIYHSLTSEVLLNNNSCVPQNTFIIYLAETNLE